MLLDRSVDLNRSSGTSATKTDAATSLTDSSVRTDKATGTNTSGSSASTDNIESPVRGVDSPTAVHEELPTSVIDLGNGWWWRWLGDTT